MPLLFSRSKKHADYRDEYTANWSRIAWLRFSAFTHLVPDREKMSFSGVFQVVSLVCDLRNLHFQKIAQERHAERREFVGLAHQAERTNLPS
jgi:hypothetical protein